MVVKRRCNSCKQTAEFPCSCCGYELHHVGCSDHGCEKHWNGVESFRLGRIEELSKQPKSLKEEMEEELANLKAYMEKEKEDTITPREIKEWVAGYISYLEREITLKQKTETKMDIIEIQRNLQTRLAELDKYKPETFYSRPLNHPINISCPHWQKYCRQVIDEELTNAREAAIADVNTHWNTHRTLPDDTINGHTKAEVLNSNWENKFTSLTTVDQINIHKNSLKSLIDYQINYQAAIEHTSKLSLQVLPTKKGGQ